MSFSDEDLKRLEDRMNRLCTLWDSERKDHFNKCRTLDIAFREATEVFNALGPLLARLEAAEKALLDATCLCGEHGWTDGKDCDCGFVKLYKTWRKTCGR